MNYRARSPFALLALITATTLTACVDRAAERGLSIPFVATYDGQPVSCATPLDAATRLTDLRFFVSGVSLRDAEGRWRRATAAEVSLIDFEDATGACQNGSPAITTAVTASFADVDGLRFDLGVPFELNHQDPLKAAAPLDQPAMHWHWRSGYKFLRAGVERNGQRWHVHLGSTGCKGPMTAVESCASPNRSQVTLADWQPGDVVELKLDQLLRGVVIDAEASHCLASISNPACQAIASNLGLDPETGLPGSTQTVFHIMRQP